MITKSRLAIFYATFVAFVVDVVLDVLFNTVIQVPVIVEALLDGSLVAVTFYLLFYYNGLVPLVRLTQKLRETTALREALLMSIGEGLVATDKQANIIYVNRAFEALSGWKAEDVIAQRVTDAISLAGEKGEPLDTAAQIVPLLVGGKVEASIVHIKHSHLVRKDGGTLPVSITAAPVILDGSVIGAVETLRDITDEARIDEAKSEFLYLASHQLKTPPAIIKQFAEMLKTGDVGTLSDKQSEYLDEIRRANDRMLGIIDALLDISRIETGSFAIDPHPVDLTKLVDTAIDDEVRRSGRRVEVARHYDAGLAPVSVDANLLHIVVTNLISNGIKYSPREHARLEVGIRLDARDVVVSVTDAGLGIPEKDQPRVFSKLFRADNVRSLDVDGNGLGLYIVRKILDAAGGMIAFDSVAGKGTTFYVRLPRSGMIGKTGTTKLASRDVSSQVI